MKIKKVFKYLWGKLKKLGKWLWTTIKSFKTVKGILSLLISFLIWYSPMIVLLGIGIIFKNAWCTTIGTAMVLFWAGPFTPLMPLFLGTAIFIRKKIFRENIKNEEVICENSDDSN